MTEFGPDMEANIDNSLTCYRMSTGMAMNHCLDMGGAFATAPCQTHADRIAVPHASLP